MSSSVSIVLLLYLLKQTVQGQLTSSSQQDSVYSFYVSQAYGQATNNGPKDIMAVVAFLQDHIRSLQTKHDELIQRMNELERINGAAQSTHAVYVRWGKTHCPGDAGRIFRGYMAGAHHGQNGGTSDRLCLPEDPQWGTNSFGKGLESMASYVYGTEYEISSEGNPFSVAQRDIHSYDAPCALCTVTGRSTHVMMAGRTQCPLGWNLEYKGYLMSSLSRPTRPQTQAVCVDETPDVIPGSRANRNEALLYVVMAKCGSLPCPPYSERELACVVCTK